MNSDSNPGRREIWLLTCCALLLGIQVSQAQPAAQVPEANKASVAKAIANVSSGSFRGVDLDLIRKTGAVEAIPALEEQFRRVQDPQDKANIAGTLVKLGDKDNTYWDFLAQLATQALESDAPDFMSYDSQGKALPGPSPEFIAWAKAYNLLPNGPEGTAAEDAMYWLPGKVAVLGSTGDPRAIPLLRRALSSPNHMIEVMAAKGLAEMHDENSIPLIIDACKRAPAEAASAIAESLVYFDDPTAQKAVDTYINEDRAKLLREAKAQAKKTRRSTE